MLCILWDIGGNMRTACTAYCTVHVFLAVFQGEGAQQEMRKTRQSCSTKQQMNAHTQMTRKGRAGYSTQLVQLIHLCTIFLVP